jgi:hypothetical protein
MTELNFIELPVLIKLQLARSLSYFNTEKELKGRAYQTTEKNPELGIFRPSPT